MLDTNSSVETADLIMSWWPRLDNVVSEQLDEPNSATGDAWLGSVKQAPDETAREAITVWENKTADSASLTVGRATGSYKSAHYRNRPA